MNSPAENKRPKFVTSILFILLTFIIALMSVMPIFTLNEDEMKGDAALAYTNGSITSLMKSNDREIEFSLFNVLSSIPNIKHIVTLITLQEKEAILNRLLKNTSSDSERNETLKELAENTKQIEKFIQDSKTKELLSKESFQASVKMYYAVRFMLLNDYLFLDEVIILAGSDDTPAVFLIFMASPIVMAALTISLLITLVVNFVKLLIGGFKNAFKLKGMLNETENELPQSLIPKKILPLLPIVLIIKLLFGNLVSISFPVIIIFAASLCYALAFGIYRLIGNANSRKNICILLIRIVSLVILLSSLIMFAKSGLLPRSLEGLRAFAEANGNEFDGKNATEEFLKAFATRFIVEFILKAIFVLYATSLITAIARNTAGKEINVSDEEKALVFGKCDAPVLSIFVTVLAFVPVFLYPEQAIIAAVLTAAGAALYILSGQIPKLMGEPDPIPEEKQKDKDD